MTETLDQRATTISPAEAARRLGIQPSTLANYRWSGRGPAYVKVGGRVRYRVSAIAEYLDEQTRQSTSEGLEVQDEDEIEDEPLDERDATGSGASPSTSRPSRPTRT